MAHLDLEPYKPIPDTTGDANAFQDAFDAIMAVVNGGIGADNFDAGQILSPDKLTSGGGTARQVLAWDGTALKYAPVKGLTKVWDSVDAGVVLPVASITTPTLPACRELLVVIEAVSSGAASNVLVRANGDSGVHYGDASYATSAGVMAVTQNNPSTLSSMKIAKCAATGVAPACGEIVIPGAGSAKTVHEFVGDGTLCSGVTIRASFAGNFTPAVAAAISTLTFLPDSGNFAAGTRISVYAVD